MIGTPKIGALERATLTGTAHGGLAATADGKPARLAIIDDAGNILETGPQVAREAWNVALACYRNFLIGQGHLVVQTEPTQDQRTRQMAA